MDVENAVTFPMEDDDWLTTTLVGGVINIAGILFFPIFLLNGYFLNVAREAMAGATEPPAFDDWERLFVDGIKAFVVLFVYQLIPLAVLGIVGGGSILAMLSGSEAGTGVGLLGLVGGFTIYGLLALVFNYFGLAGLMNFVATDSLGDAFDVEVLGDVATDRSWLLAWGYVVAINLAFGLAFTVVSLIPIVGLVTMVVAPFAYFYLGVVMYRIFGLGFAEATSSGPTSTETTAAEPA